MSAATIVAIAETAILLVVVLFLVGLLRSHAEILRRLEAIDPSGDSGVRSGAATGAAAGAGLPGPDGAGRGGPSHDIVGESLGGDAVKLALGPGAPRTLLAFLSSGCEVCVPLWEGLGDGLGIRAAAKLAPRVVAVTKGPERERVARLLELAPAQAEVVMSSAAWEEYAVPASPHFVLVDGGVINGRGSAISWEQIAGLLADADADDAIYRSRDTSDRAARAEDALTTSGITAGHPSLYPSRRDNDE